MEINPQLLQAYLEGRLSEEDSLKVQVWLAGHMDDAEVAFALEAAFDGCRSEAGKADESALSAIRHRLGLGGKRPSRAIFWLAAAVVALLVCIPFAVKTGYRLHKDPAPVAWQEITVPATETREVTLPDGTLLTLNAGTRMTWPDSFTGDSREIFLEGEVMARVKKDPEHPFIIHSGDVDVLVHGTTFNFKSYRGETMAEMVLLDGSVSMDVPSAGGKREVRLTPGDIAIYDRSEGNVSLSKLSPENFRSFSEGRYFSFFNVPLRDIVADLERSFGTRIIVGDEQVAGHRFLAFFTNGESLDDILSLLARNGNLRIATRDGVIYINRK